MQTKYPVHNPGKNAMYVAGTMIPSGETQHFTLEQLPVHLRPVAVDPEPELDQTQYDPLAELLEGNVKTVVAALPDLSDEDLARLGEMEQAKGETARKGVLSAIAEETLMRADASPEAGAGGA